MAFRTCASSGVRVLHSGGPGVQLSGVRGGRFTALEVDGSGSTRDTRNWGRGSGLWTWGSSDIVIEQGRFLNANGPGDSAGVHIDYDCRDVVVQYNLSVHNAGGFCEVLGNNSNCAYRYNVSVNDGYRVKGKAGAFQEGKTFWLSGYIGKGPRRGPFNTYFYNNTIYVNEEIASPHRNCVPPDFARGKSQAGVRGDMVYEFDWSVGRVLAKLDEIGIADNTLVIVTSDNGAVPKSDEGEDFGHQSNGELRGSKGGLFEGGHRVPFLVRWPGQAPAGRTNASLVVLTDLMATLAGLVGEKLPAGAGPDSFNILRRCAVPRWIRPLARRSRCIRGRDNFRSAKARGN